MSIGHVLLCAFLILFGVSLIIGGIAIPGWLIGLLAVGAGVLLLMGR